MQNATGLTITNPLVLYRALTATNRIRPDPAQLRLALHLQKLYDRLKDYEPTLQYSQRLQRLGRALGPSVEEKSKGASIGSRGIWQSLIREKEKRDSLALTRVLSDHEEALTLDSPQGLMVHGEVGTGKSMLIDLFAESLPTRKKRRWHFNTFMLETFAKLEQLRISRASRPSSDDALGLDDHSMLWLARDLIEKSPILFLDEFQLPDRASAKIMTSLMTRFFGLGGVLIATSNRMPDELAKAAGIEIFQPTGRRGIFGWRGSAMSDRSSRMFPGHGEFAQFLELLKARCEVWEMEGKSDYRRMKEDKKPVIEEVVLPHSVSGTIPNPTQKERDEEGGGLPAKYFIQTKLGLDSLPPEIGMEIVNAVQPQQASAAEIPWQSTAVMVYGRQVPVPRSMNNTALYTFNELCCTTLGPADYITLASRFHTFIITDVPVLTSALKNEARRFITLLDALYEAKCKLLISALADPDNLFFPELRRSNGDPIDNAEMIEEDGNVVHAETFSEVHQDLTAPFRPNISVYSESNIDNTHSRLQGILAEDALEDGPPNRIKRMLGKTDSDFLEDDKYQVKLSPNFAQAGLFLGEDEKFAYKRATSRLWEMCASKWWERNEEGWWRPLPMTARAWENSEHQSRIGSQAIEASTANQVAKPPLVEGMGALRDVTENEDEIMFKYGTSPFRTSTEPPPEISWTHIWGLMKWGKKAGAWGRGVEGLEDKKKDNDK